MSERETIKTYANITERLTGENRKLRTLVKQLAEALEQQIRTFESKRKYNRKGDAQNMYEIAKSALAAWKEQCND